jgi:hypothetical protein
MLAYHAVFRRPDGSGYVVFGEKAIALDSEQFKFFLAKRWYFLSTDREAYAPANVLHWFDAIGFPRPVHDTAEAMSAPEARGILNAALNTWKPLLYTHQVYCDAKCDRVVALAFLLERSHFTTAAPRVVEFAASQARSQGTASLLARLANDERDHCESLAVALGLTRKELESHSPSVALKSLLLALEALAQKDPLAFACALSFLESWNPANPGGFYDSIHRQTGLDTSAFLEHVSEDAELHHGDFWVEVLKCEGEDLIRDRIDVTVDAIHTIKHMIDAWNDAIVAGAKAAEPFICGVADNADAIRLLLSRSPATSDFRARG